MSVGVVALDGSLMAGNASPAATRSYASIRARSSGCSSRPPRSTRARTPSWATAAAMSCRPSWPIGVRGASGCAAARRSWSANNAPSSRPRGEPRLARGLGGRARPQAGWPQAGAARPWRARRAQDQYQRSRHAADEARRRALGAGLQRPGRGEPRAGNPCCRRQPVPQRRRPARADGRNGPRGAPARRDRGADRDRAGRRRLLELGGDQRDPSPRQRVLVPTQDAGAANRASSRPAKATKPDGSRPCSPHPRARRSTDADNNSSSRSSPNTKVIRRADRFLRRGLVACQAEWRLIAATHNLLKLWRAGWQPPHAKPAAARRLTPRRARRRSASPPNVIPRRPRTAAPPRAKALRDSLKCGRSEPHPWCIAVQHDSGLERYPQCVPAPGAQQRVSSRAGHSGKRRICREIVRSG